MKKTLAILAMCTAALLTACSDDGGIDDPGALPISFRIASSSSATTAAGAVAGRQADAALTITGDNGTLEITRIAVIVKKFELEPVEVAECDDVEPKPETCVDIKKRHFFIDMPVGGNDVSVVDADVPEGSYKELEIKIDDIDFDDDDDVADADGIATLSAAVRAEFPAWPEDASMVVVGTFTPTDGTAVPFTTYFKAKIEVELEFSPALVVPDDTQDGIQVALHPELWFVHNGEVGDLSESPNELREFELEIKDGFQLEFDDDDNNDDDDN